MRDGSTVPAEFTEEIGQIASRMVRKLRLSPSQRVALIRELDLFQRAIIHHTMGMVREEFLLMPRDQVSVRMEDQ